MAMAMAMPWPCHAMPYHTIPYHTYVYIYIHMCECVYTLMHTYSWHRSVGFDRYNGMFPCH